MVCDKKKLGTTSLEDSIGNKIRLSVWVW